MFEAKKKEYDKYFRPKELLFSHTLKSSIQRTILTLSYIYHYYATYIDMLNTFPCKLFYIQTVLLKYPPTCSILCYYDIIDRILPVYARVLISERLARIRNDVFDELIGDGLLEFAQREIKEGTYEKNAGNRSINYADRLALETKTTPLLIEGENLVNDYMLNLSVNRTQDEETVRELMRRLTIISVEYRLLIEKYERTIDWMDRRDPNGRQFEVEPEDIWEIYTDVVSS